MESMQEKALEALSDFEKSSSVNEQEWSIVVYIAYNKETGYYYIGASTKKRDRFSCHLSLLLNNKHININFQNAYNDNKNFEWKYINVCDGKTAFNIEQQLIDKFKDDQYCLNIATSSPPSRAGCKLSEAHKAALKEANKNRVITQETKDKVRAALLGRKRPIEVIEKMRRALLGKKATNATREKLRAAQQKRRLNGVILDSTREKLRAANLGKTHTQATRDKISKNNKGKIVSSEAREKIRLFHLGKPKNPKAIEKTRQFNIGNKYNLGKRHSLKTIQKLSEIAKKQHQSIKMKEKIREGIIKAIGKPVLINDIKYISISDASRSLGINEGTISSRIKNTNFQNYKSIT